jgi:hypothetical protein
MVDVDKRNCFFEFRMGALCSANRRKDFRGEFSNRRPMSSSFSSVKTRFLFNGFLSMKMLWV